jgi:hypothetical protein
MKKTTSIFILGIFLFLVLTSGVYAKTYSKICLNKGETIFFSQCNPGIDDRICKSDSCQYCTYIGSKGFYCPAKINECNGLGLSCSYVGAGWEPDMTDPEILFISFEEGEVYSSKKHYFTGEADEVVDWYYSYDGVKFKRICREEQFCNKKITLKEGQNTLVIKVNDLADNPSEQSVSFSVDSKKPKISKTSPRKGFATGDFEIKFKEQNPKQLILHYNSEQKIVNLTTNCSSRGAYTYCTTSIDLELIEENYLDYYFELIDIADTTAFSKTISLDVDTDFPEINNPDDFLEFDGKYLKFNIDITEENLDEVLYIYNDSKGKLKEKRLCSRLKYGMCEKKIRFKDSYTYNSIQVIDEAGNSAGASMII